MKTNFFLLAGVLVGITSATAQTTLEPPTDTLRVSSECLLATNEQEWVGLGLTNEQVQRVQAVQTECKTDCTALSAKAAREGALSPAALAKHEARIRKVLTPEQYAKWRVWCREREGHTQLVR